MEKLKPNHIKSSSCTNHELSAEKSLSPRCLPVCLTAFPLSEMLSLCSHTWTRTDEFGTFLVLHIAHSNGWQQSSLGLRVSFPLMSGFFFLFVSQQFIFLKHLCSSKAPVPHSVNAASLFLCVFSLQGHLPLNQGIPCWCPMPSNESNESRVEDHWN